MRFKLRGWSPTVATCPMCTQILKRPYPRHLSVEFLSERVPSDAIGPTWNSPCLVSHRVRSVLEKAELKGLKYADVDILKWHWADGKAKRRPPGTNRYYGLLPSGRPLEWAENGYQAEGKCRRCGRPGFNFPPRNFPSGYVFREGAWNGADLFVLKYMPYVFLASERFADVWVRNKLRGLEFEDPSYVWGHPAWAWTSKA